GAYAPFPNPMAMGTLPTIAVMGAAVATAMNMTPNRPTAPRRNRCTSGAFAALVFSLFGAASCGCDVIGHLLGDIGHPMWSAPHLTGEPPTSVYQLQAFSLIWFPFGCTVDKACWTD